VRPQGDEPGAAPSAPGARAAEAPDAGLPSQGLADRAVAAPTFRAIASEALFGGAGEVRISHRGSLYRLKQTALGKLILTK
jgi:hemin uptake protein HemP